jgi:hypothetical protein
VSAKSVKLARRRPRNARLKRTRTGKSVTRRQKLTARRGNVSDQHASLTLHRLQRGPHKPAWSQCLVFILNKHPQVFRRHTQRWPLLLFLKRQRQQDRSNPHSMARTPRHQCNRNRKSRVRPANPLHQVVPCHNSSPRMDLGSPCQRARFSRELILHTK